MISPQSKESGCVFSFFPNKKIFGKGEIECERLHEYEICTTVFHKYPGALAPRHGRKYGAKCLEVGPPMKREFR